MNKKSLLPMNIQMFASEAEGGAESNQAENTADNGGENKGATIEELMAELARVNAENAKLNNKANDASSEAAKYKKALREKQTAEEIKSEEELKAQEEYRKYVSDLESFKKKTEAETRYALQGMNKELAMKAAEAEINGDMDELASIQRKHTENLIKEKEKEWLKSRPDISMGGDPADERTLLEKEIEGIMLGNGFVSN